MSKINDENYLDLNLLYKSIVYFLRENDKINEAAQVISLLDNRTQDANKAYSLITSCLESLPQISCPEYEEAMKLLYEGGVPPREIYLQLNPVHKAISQLTTEIEILASCKTCPELNISFIAAP